MCVRGDWVTDVKRGGGCHPHKSVPRQCGSLILHVPCGMPDMFHGAPFEGRAAVLLRCQAFQSQPLGQRQDWALPVRLCCLFSDTCY